MNNYMNALAATWITFAYCLCFVITYSSLIIYSDAASINADIQQDGIERLSHFPPKNDNQEYSVLPVIQNNEDKDNVNVPSVLPVAHKFPVQNGNNEFSVLPVISSDLLQGEQIASTVLPVTQNDSLNTEKPGSEKISAVLPGQSNIDAEVLDYWEKFKQKRSNKNNNESTILNVIKNGLLEDSDSNNWASWYLGKYVNNDSPVILDTNNNAIGNNIDTGTVPSTSTSIQNITANEQIGISKIMTTLNHLINETRKLQLETSRIRAIVEQIRVPNRDSYVPTETESDVEQEEHKQYKIASIDIYNGHIKIEGNNKPNFPKNAFNGRIIPTKDSNIYLEPAYYTENDQDKPLEYYDTEVNSDKECQYIDRHGNYRSCHLQLLKWTSGNGGARQPSVENQRVTPKGSGSRRGVMLRKNVIRAIRQTTTDDVAILRERRPTARTWTLPLITGLPDRDLIWIDEDE